MHIMSNSEPSWEWYRTFLQVLATGSLSGAARAMGMTQPTAGRHIDALEASLGVTLFTRTHDGFAPTDVARELEPYAVNLASNAAALRRTASGYGTAIRGSVRLSASEVIGVEVLPPILAALRARHRELRIELVLSNAPDDLLRREADIAVRMFRPEQAALLVRRVGAIEVGLYARADYLAREGMPESLEALGRHATIGFDQETAFIRALQQRHGESLRRDTFSLRTDSDLAHLAAIRAGFGVGFCQCHLAARTPRVVRVLADAFVLKMDTWIAMHENLRGSPRCMVVFNALAEGLKSYIEHGADAPQVSIGPETG
ncbi:LysR family transcriptional regulator [Robbsia andropogonis]|uniref:LysR family transcriptional regulator n=2 Tax=Robbsia andropogonis TaxID=28092 RepID=A0A0F5JY92_9BURK|nr:LysR family transcriptional regulator [Robbsia andropogonis]